jgi:anaerobic selenocysteine-containing dehydrogenase
MVKKGKTEQTPSLCRMCDNRCGINVTVENGRITDITGLKEHKWNHGRICVKGRLGVDQVNAPDRLLHPLKRVGNRWKRLTLSRLMMKLVKE